MDCTRVRDRIPLTVRKIFRLRTFPLTTSQSIQWFTNRTTVHIYDLSSEMVILYLEFTFWGDDFRRDSTTACGRCTRPHHYSWWTAWPIQGLPDKVSQGPGPYIISSLKIFILEWEIDLAWKTWLEHKTFRHGNTTHNSFLENHKIIRTHVKISFKLFWFTCIHVISWIIRVKELGPLE